MANAIRSACGRRTNLIDIGAGQPVSPIREPQAMPALVCATWMDFAPVAWELLRHRVDALLELATTIRDATIVVIPYSSTSDDESSTDLVGSGPESAARATSVASIGALEAALCEHGVRYRTIVAPMVIHDPMPAPAAHPSMLNQLARTVRALVDEVQGKVPQYFSRYSLQLAAADRSGVNAVTLDHLAAWLHVRLAVPITVESDRACEQAQHWQSWPSVLDELQSGVEVPLRCCDGGALNPLDHVLAGIMALNGGSALEPLAFRADPVRVPMPRDPGFASTLRRLAVTPGSALDSSYVLVREPRLDPDMEALAVPDGTGDRCYGAGSGEAVLVLCPLGIDAAYFTHLVAGLSGTFRVLLWNPGAGPEPDRAASDAPRQCEPLYTTLRQHRISRCHVIAWCGAATIASHLVEHDAISVLSLTLIAPDLCSEECQTEGYRSLLAFYALVDRHPDQVGRIVAETRKRVPEVASTVLEQFSADSPQARSPLQYHPVGFSVEKIYADDACTLQWARQSLDNVSRIAGTRLRLARYRGPMLILLGTNDGLVSYDGAMKACRDFSSAAYVTIVGGNHYFVLEHGPAVARIVRQFVSGKRTTATDPGSARDSRIHMSHAGAG